MTKTQVEVITSVQRRRRWRPLFIAPGWRVIMAHMPPGLPKPPPPIMSALMLVCALIVVGLALSGVLQQIRATRAPVAVVAK
jgi:hypothetical protein